MFRSSVVASLIIACYSIAAFAQDARQLTCTGTMIEPSAMSQSPETVVMTLGPGQKIALDLGKGVVNARRVSDNKIQHERVRGGVLSLHRGPILHLQDRTSHEANVPEARRWLPAGELTQTACGTDRSASAPHSSHQTSTSIGIRW